MPKLKPHKFYRMFKKAVGEIDLTIYRDGKELIKTKGIATDKNQYLLTPFDEFEVKVGDVIFDGYNKSTIDYIGAQERANGIWLVNTSR